MINVKFIYFPVKYVVCSTQVLPPINLDSGGIITREIIGNDGLLEDCSITLVDKTDGSDPTKRDKYWRTVLKTVTPCELNTIDIHIVKYIPLTYFISSICCLCLRFHILYLLVLLFYYYHSYCYCGQYCYEYHCYCYCYCLGQRCSSQFQHFFIVIAMNFTVVLL